MSKEYVHSQIVAIPNPDREGEVVGKIFRGLDAKDKAKDFYFLLVSKGMDCFRAEIVEEHGEG